MSFFVHPQGLCESQSIGKGTRIWAFAHVLPGAKIGADCNVCDHVFIENDVIVGDRVTIKCGVQLWDAARVEDDVFIGPNVTFSNDRFPRSKQRPADFPRTLIEKGASIGANSTVLPGIRIGRHSMIGAGSLVSADVPPFAIVKGNPAQIVGYVNTERQSTATITASSLQSGQGNRVPLSIEGVAVHRLHHAMDLRGHIAVAELGKHVPFEAKRLFLVYDVPSRYVRGEHAHRVCHQFLVAAHGSIAIVVDDGEKRSEVLLDSPNFGIHIPPMVWATQYDHTPGATLLVLASEHYDEKDYIRDYTEFVRIRAAMGASAIEPGKPRA